MNSAINYMSAGQMQHEALRMSLREPRVPDVEKPARSSSHRRFAFLWRLRPALV